MDQITAVVTVVAVALGSYAAWRLVVGADAGSTGSARAAPAPDRAHERGRAPASEGGSVKDDSKGDQALKDDSARDQARERPRGVDLADSTAPPAPRTTLTLDHPADAHPVIWVRRGREVEIYTEPGGGELADRVGKRTEFGSPTVFGVVRRVGDWAGVTTPVLPNGRLGWVNLDRRRLRAGWTKLSIVVDLSARRAELRHAGAPRRVFAITVGAAGSETPTGRFAVTDTLRGGLNPAYGCCALALSATQPNTPTGWLGGRRIAIHGTTGPLGVAASLGCVRAADAEVSELVSRVPLGTPVFIRG